MGSGLILLVIVGAWLAVLVPMALRSHDSTSSLSSVDRFNDAMRVLSRRDAMARLRERGVVTPPRRTEPAARPARSTQRRDVVDSSASPSSHADMSALERRTGPTLAQRRRRLLGLLVLLAVGCLVGGLLGPVWLLGVSGGFALLAVAYVVHLRRQALRRQREQRRPAARGDAARRTRPQPRRTAPGRITGIPDRLPARPAPAYVPLPAEEPLPATAQRYDDPAPIPAAVGGAWDPVPVPVPTYVNAPMAPPRVPRVVDLTSPGRYSDALRDAEERLGIVDHGPELDDILDRRRAVNGW